MKELQSIELEQLCRKMLETIAGQTREFSQQRRKAWEKARQYYNGNQRGFWDSGEQCWKFVDTDSLTPTEQSVFIVNNQIRSHVRTLTKEFARSLTKIKILPRNDTIISQASARLVDKLSDYYYMELMDEIFKQAEARHLILTGNAFRYLYFEDTLTKREQKIIKAKDYIFCENCGEIGENLEICENCGANSDLEKLIVEEQLTDKLDDLRYELKNELVSPDEVYLYEKSSKFEESPYLLRKRNVLPEILKDFYREDYPDDVSIKDPYFFPDSMQKQNDAYNKTVSYTQVWLKPCMYRNYKLAKKWKDYEVGTPLVKLFPKGLYFVAINEVILENYIWNEDFRDYWTHVIYDISLESVYGIGIEDALQSQQLINELTSMIVENALYNAAPKLVINPRLINPTTLSSHPRDVVQMNQNAQDLLPQQAFAVIPSTPISQDVYMVLEGSKRDMREQTGALLAFNGLGDPNISTATGASIARDSALALVSLSLALRSEADCKWLKKLLKIVQRTHSPEKLKFLLGKYNELEIKAFFQCDIDKDLEFTIEARSWLPATPYERLQNLNAYLSAFGLPLGYANPMIPSSIREYAAELFQVPIEFDQFKPDVRIARKRLLDAKTILLQALQSLGEINSIEELEGAADNVVKILMGAMAPDPDLDNHEIMIAEYLSQLKSDEGQQWHELFKLAVRETIQLHRQIIEQQKIIQLIKEQQTKANLAKMTGQPMGEGENQNSVIPPNNAEELLSQNNPEAVYQASPSQPPFMPLTTVPIKPIAPVNDFAEAEKAEELAG